MNTYKYGSNGRNRIGGTKNELRKMGMNQDPGLNFCSEKKAIFLYLLLIFNSHNLHTSKKIT